jgi:uncharacterized membrane protein
MSQIICQATQTGQVNVSSYEWVWNVAFLVLGLAVMYVYGRAQTQIDMDLNYKTKRQLRKLFRKKRIKDLEK